MKTWTLVELIDGFAKKDKNALARSITFAESQRIDHQELIHALLKKLKPTKPSVRLGISGTPGVGKSSFIEVFGLSLIEKNLSVAVLAVDPSSQVSGGSILGDKTRMDLLARAPQAFIRPSPSGGALGGVARRTRESIQLCEAFGFDVVMVETVGVGQSETTVAHLVDCFMMLLQPGAGDDLQGIKRGILELVDMVVVTKADGDNVPLAQAAKHHYQNALHILRSDLWHPPVLSCSSLEKIGFNEIWKTIQDYTQTQSNQIAHKRREQLNYWFEQELHQEFQQRMRQKVGEELISKQQLSIQQHKLTIHEAVVDIMEKLKL